MRLLILGGTQFVGRYITEYALQAGHSVTLFNRGRTNPGLFRYVETLHGDRDGGLAPLEGRTWDGVIDVSGYVPRIVGQSADLLADSVDVYAFISTMAAVDAETLLTTPGIDENAPTRTLDNPDTEEINGETYGGLKVLCERTVEEHLPGQSLIIRPGFIVGPNDHTDRFTYWPVRTNRGGEMLAPPTDAPIQFIDARDLAAWTIRMVERGSSGLYNAVGPSVTFEHLLAASRDVVGEHAAEPIHASDDFLQEQGITGQDLPLWFRAEQSGIMQVSNQRAIDEGLTLRDVETTVADTLVWFRDERGIDDPLRAGMSVEKEQATIVNWKAAVNSG